MWVNRATPTRSGWVSFAQGAATLVLGILLGARLASATTGESYPRGRMGDTSINAQRNSWTTGLTTLSEVCCTGGVQQGPGSGTGGGEYFRPMGPNSLPDDKPLPLSEFKSDDGAVYRGPGAGGPSVSMVKRPPDPEADPMSQDVYVFIDLTPRRASFFFKSIVETKNGKKWGWRFNYIGDDVIHYVNGPTKLGLTLTVSNPAKISWARKIVDYDMRDGTAPNKIKSKRIVQNWDVACLLIDGTQLVQGRKFERHVPDSLTVGSSKGTQKSAGGELGWQGSGPVVKGTGGITWVNTDDQSAQSQNWAQLYQDFEGTTGIVTGTAGGSALCPCDHQWFCKTNFAVVLDMVDESSGNLGARQELLIKTHNQIASIVVADCVPCPYLPEPTDPQPSGPPPTTPTTAPIGGPVSADYVPSNPPVTTPSDSQIRDAKRPEGTGRDVDGDGKREGQFIGPNGPVASWAGPPYWLGVARLQQDPGVYTSIERWAVAGSADGLCSALVDPWDTDNGRLALVVVKDGGGVCHLREVERALTGTADEEEWWDRYGAVPATLFSCSTLKSTSLSALFPGESVAGADLREVVHEGQRVVLVSPILVGRWTDCDPEPEESIRYLASGPEYKVSINGQGQLELELFDW